MKESPLFLKSFETLKWFLNHTSKFPKSQRFVLAKRMEEAFFDFHEGLLMAARVSRRNLVRQLLDTDFHLARLKDYNRLAVSLKYQSFKQYEYLAAELDEIGRMLGAWLKSASGEKHEDSRARGERLAPEEG